MTIIESVGQFLKTAILSDTFNVTTFLTTAIDALNFDTILTDIKSEILAAIPALSIVTDYIDEHVPTIDTITEWIVNNVVGLFDDFELSENAISSLFSYLLINVGSGIDNVTTTVLGGSLKWS